MHRKVAMAIMALSLGACFILTSPPATAQMGQQHQQGKAQGQSRGGGSAATPRGGGATRTVTTPRATRAATPQATRTVTPRTTRTVTTPRATPTVAPQATRTVTPRTSRTVTPRTTRTVTPKVIRRVTPRGSRVVTAGKLRGAGRTTIHGHNYSVWHGGHRVRHGHGWQTFVALNALGAIAIGASEYYPYAYISAPEPYCDGLTEDGCQLLWQEVMTLEGDVINQCVAYCPWQ